MTAIAGLNELERILERARDDHRVSIASVLSSGLATRDTGEGLHAAILLKEFGAASAAGRVFARLNALHGDEPAVIYERAVFLRANQAPALANRVIARALECGVVSPSIALDLLLASQLDETTAHVAREANQLFTRARAMIVDPIIEALCAYFTRKGPALRNAARLDPARQALPGTVFRRVLRAMRAGRPFCFLRLGDGEGAFLEREANQTERPIFVENRAYWARRWCGVDGEDTRLRAAADELMPSLAEADVLGVPAASWIANELVRRQARGLLGCCAATFIGMQTGVPLASTTLPMDWQARRMIAALLRHAGTIDLVTCRPGVAALFEEKLGITVARVIEIAPPSGETGNLPGLIDDLPRVRAQVQSSAAGRVVMIGAGFLGKTLALDAKRAGAIGIDLGSVLDLLARVNTRHEFLGLSADL